MAREAPKSTAISGTFPFSRSPGITESLPTVGQDAREMLQRSQGEDHTVSHRHLSLRHYPQDCPPLKPRWHYAVDAAKWKPSPPDQKREKLKPLPSPRKFVPFTLTDSQSIEKAFQDMCNTEIEREQAHCSNLGDSIQNEHPKVPVNEDYLFDVDINRRELGPAYWSGPSYEVRRGTWFFQEGSAIKPCEENLATQLEEVYLKVKPWRSETPSEHSSQPPPTLISREHDGTANISTATPGETRKHRLFGSYMNSFVTYQDATTALLTSDGFMSRKKSQSEINR